MLVLYRQKLKLKAQLKISIAGGAAGNSHIVLFLFSVFLSFKYHHQD